MNRTINNSINNASSPYLLNIKLDKEGQFGESKKEEKKKIDEIQDKDFINSRLKRDHISNNISMTRLNHSVYHNDYRQGREQKYVKSKYANRAQESFGKQNSKPSLYKNSLYQETYSKKPIAEKYLRQTNSHILFQKTKDVAESTYQRVYQKPEKKIISTYAQNQLDQPIRPPPAAYFVQGLQFKADSVYDSTYLKFPKIQQEKQMEKKDHLERIGLGSGVFKSEYRENFLKQKVTNSPQKALVPSDNNHYFQH